MGGYEGHVFSSCSIDMLNDHFDNNGAATMACLADTGEAVSTNGWSEDSISCVTQVSGKSGSSDDATTSVSCPSGYTMTGKNTYIV